jgi:S1-C subfamily serine protease
MKSAFILLGGAFLLHTPLRAQEDIPLLLPEEQKAVDAQTEEFNTAIRPVLTDAAKSTVRIWSGKRRLAYGTVIGEGNRILTKWSEVARAANGILIQTASGETRSAKVTGVYEDEDLAVLEIAGTPLPAVRWSKTAPKLGSFIAAPQPDGRPAAFGVVSVLERNLRETDQAFLGVLGDIDHKGPGVRIRSVTEESGAAAAGIKPGDVILKVGQREISGLLELKNSLVGISPGSTVKVLAQTRDGEKTFDVLLGNRPQLPSFPGDRLRVMERMGTTPSRVRDSFSRVIQTDMRLEPNLVGGPVVNLKGEVIGITMARGDRTRSFVMPASAVTELLDKPATDPSVAKVRQPDEQAALPVRRRMRQAPQELTPRAEERMRQHLSEMQRLMDFMREEMEALEGGGNR